MWWRIWLWSLKEEDAQGGHAADALNIIVRSGIKKMRDLSDFASMVILPCLPDRTLSYSLSIRWKKKRGGKDQLPGKGIEASIFNRSFLIVAE